MRKDWDGAAHLVGRISVWLGLLLVITGLAKSAVLYVQSHRGIETLATIEASKTSGMSSGGFVDLSWRDDIGTQRHAFGIQVTSGLGRKLRLGSALARTHLRIRYRPESDRASILVIEDVPEQIKSAAALAIAGFMAVSAGSLLVLFLMLSGRAPASAPIFGIPLRRTVETEAENGR